MVEIANHPSAVRFDFNEASEAFDASVLVVDKSGARLYLMPDKQSIQVNFSDGRKIEIKQGEYLFFKNPNTGVSFVSMETLFDELSSYLYSHS